MKQYTVADRIKITKTILKARNCKNSTEFVFITFDLYELMYPAYAKIIEPCIAVEAYNRKTDWVENVVFSENIIASYDDPVKIKAIAMGYRTVLDFMVNDEACSQIFPMDDDDHIGWQIWKELDKKYAYANLHAKRKENV